LEKGGESKELGEGKGEKVRRNNSSTLEK